MSSTVERLSSNQVRIDFAADPEIFERGMANAYKKLVKRINIPGFRKGHAPRKVIELHYGESVFYEDAFDDVFPQLYQDAIAEHSLSVVDRPELDVKQIGAGKPLEFSVTVYVKPDVELGEYKGVKVEKHAHSVEEEDVEAELLRERERVARMVEVTDRPVQLDDTVNIDYQGFADGEPFDGGTAEGQPLVIGSGQFIPGFEEQLIGKAVGDETDINVTFPETYHAENLKGKPARFHVKIHGIQYKELPDLDDEFAKDVSECDTLADYRKQVREKLEKQNQDHIDAEFENDVLEQVVEGAKTDIPSAMVDDQVESMIRDMEMRMMYQGMRLDDYMKYTGQTLEQLREMYREDAGRRVKTQLVLEAVRKAEGIEADEEAINEEMRRFADQGQKSLEEFGETLSESDRQYFAEMAAMKKTVALLKESAVVTNEADAPKPKAGKRKAAAKASAKADDGDSGAAEE